MSVVDKIQHYQRSLERCTDNELRTLHCIDKLYKLPVTVQHLKVTGVGRTVNALRKFDGSVGDAAKALVAKWKTMVVDDETSEEEDEACVPDAPEGYSDHSNSPKFDRDNGDDRNSSNYKTSESREKTSRSTDKHESSRHGTKNSSSSENSKPRENELKSTRETSGDKYKCSKNGITDKKHTKSDAKSEKKSKSSRDSKDARSESKSDSGKEASTSSRSRVKTEDSRKDSSRVSSSSGGSANGGSGKSSNSNHDSHRKRKLDSSSSERESSKRRRSVESSVDDEYDDPDEVATQVLSRDSDDEAGKALPDTSIDTDSEDEGRTKPKIKREVASPPPTQQRDERDVSHSKHSGKTDKSSKSKSRENSSSGKTTSSGSEKSRRDSEKSEKSKSERSVEHRKNEKRKDRSPGKESSSKSKSHGGGSSGSKDPVPGKEKDKDECGESSKGKRDRSDCDSKDSKEKFKEPKDKKVKKKKISKDDGIDCNSGASFAEALGMCTDRPVARKKPNPVSPSSPVVKTIKTEPGTSASSSSSSAPSSSSGGKSAVKVKTEPPASSDPEPLSLLAPNVKLEPLNVDLASTLPEISPNYKPLPAHYVNPVHRKQEESRALSDVIYAKTARTKVYSGMKSGYTSVPTLCEEAIRVLIENIHELGFTGGIPYDIIKPVLERATPDQLFTVENYNPYLIEDTDQLWQFHCNREFRTKKREEMESWRDMYLRCREEREAKLKALTANIKESIDKSVPVRSAKLAYVDKPPRNVLRQQAKYGTAKISTSSSDLKKQMILSGSSNAATNIAVPPPPMSRHKSSSSGVMKKNKAPLMAKALQLIKGRYKR